MNPLRVLVVEDSRTVRERLVEILSEDPGFEVVGHVSDGLAALRLFESKKPDVISLDMVLPGMSGLEVTRRIMSDRPTPILVVSASVNRGEALDAFDALRAGAVDIFEKSRMGKDPEWIDEFKDALRLVSRIRVVRRPNLRGPDSSDRPVQSEPRVAPWSSESVPSLVVLGASTGGPAAIAQVLSELPSNFALPILIVMHLAPLFSSSLADWLGSYTTLKVHIASDGEPLPSVQAPAPVVLAPPERHLIVERGRLRLTNAPERHSCRPSVDVLFESVALELGARTIAGVLTGMGRDGAAGLVALRDAHALTFAQDEATSAVYGMPREAVQLGAARSVLPLGQIAHYLVEASRVNPKRSHL